MTSRTGCVGSPGGVGKLLYQVPCLFLFRFFPNSSQRTSYHGNGKFHGHICCSSPNVGRHCCRGAAVPVLPGPAGTSSVTGLLLSSAPPSDSSLLRQLQQMLQTFQQPVKPESNCHLPVHIVPTHVPNVSAGLTVAAQPAPPAEPSQQKTAFDKVAKAPPQRGSGFHRRLMLLCPPETAGSLRLRRRTGSFRRIEER